MIVELIVLLIALGFVWHFMPPYVACQLHEVAIVVIIILLVYLWLLQLVNVG